VLLRSGRQRYTSEEVGADQFCDVEFQDVDSGGLALVISIYNIASAQLVQCHTEHYAGADLDPKSRPGLDLDGLVSDLEHAPRPWPFAFTANAHCNAKFASENDVRTMARNLHADLAQRSHDVSKDDMRTYVRRALAGGDLKWRAFLQRVDVKRAWLKLAGL
jgi:hypothetical protein